MPPSIDLAGQVAVVTGAGRGIGAAVCLSLAQAGVSVVALDRDEESARETARSLEGLGRPSLAVTADVGDEGQVESAFATAVQRFGRVDIAVNNAAIFGRSHVEEMPTEEWRRVMAVDLEGVFFCCRSAVRRMKPRRYGRIVNVSSVAANTFSPVSGAVYSAAKAGLLGLTRHLAIEVAQHGIAVNAVLPGFVRTPQLVERTDEAGRERLALLAPIGRLLEPDDVAAAIAFLASPAAAAVVGQGLTVDGGVTIAAGWYDAARYR